MNFFRRRALSERPSGSILLAASCLLFAGLAASVPAGKPSRPPRPAPDDAPAAMFSREALRPGPLKGAPSRGTGPFFPNTGGWIAQGPGPTLNGQVENIPGTNPVAGAIHTAAAHPTNPDILYVGGVNCGIWRTRNATSANPSWEPLTDHLRSLSVTALEFDASDPTGQALIAGLGRSSSFSQQGGIIGGILLTEDGGDSWTELFPGELFFENISGVSKRGDDLVATATFGFFIGGLFRSEDNGQNWQKLGVSGDGSNLPFNRSASDLARDPNNPDRLYAAFLRSGIYRSDDNGQSWANLTNGDSTGIDAAFDDPLNNNAEIAVGPDGRLWAGVVVEGQPGYIGWLAPDESAWNAMDLPTTLEGDGSVEGLSPRPKPGAQGAIHFSIRADPVNPDIVYVAGDRQDTPFPNFLGAEDFTGRIFRGDARIAATGATPSPQWAHMTHRNDVPEIPGGGTASSSAPHADSREMVFDANGDLIETDDGGIYRRTSPRDNAGDWFPLLGDLQPTEFHDIAYDSISNILIGGAQDTGTPQQTSPGSTTWSSVDFLPDFDDFSTGDGGDVAVDDISMADQGLSIRYSSFQFLNFFRRQTFDAQGAKTEQVFPLLEVLGTGGFSIYDFDPNLQFAQPLELNAVDASRGVIGTAQVYESMDRFETLEDVTGFTGFFIVSMAYGGRSQGADNPGVLYYGTSEGLFLRPGDGMPFAQLENYPGNAPLDIVLDPEDWRRVLTTDGGNVYFSRNAGETWDTITGSLADIGSGAVRALEYVPRSDGSGGDTLVAGLDSGVYAAFDNDPGAWSFFGSGLPGAPVFDLEYDARDDVLVAGTLGRGAWILPSAGGGLSAGASGVVAR